MLRDKIQEQMIAAMKARDKVRLEALRYLWSLIKNVEIDAKRELEDNEVIKVTGTEVKKRKEAIELMKQGGRDDLALSEEDKLKVLQEFLPEQMSEAEVEKIVDEVIAGGVSDFGRVMGQVMGRTAGKADGKVVSEIVKKKLQV